MAYLSAITIVDHRDAVMEEWRDVFDGVYAIDIELTSLEDLSDRNFDAVALPVMVAHDRLGGRPIIGRSQILETKEYGKKLVGRAKWAVTTVPFPGKAELSIDENGNQNLVIVHNDDIAAEKRLGIVFKAMIHAVQEHNYVQKSKISSLLVDLDSLGASLNNARAEATITFESIKHVFLEDYEYTSGIPEIYKSTSPGVYATGSSQPLYLSLFTKENVQQSSVSRYENVKYRSHEFFHPQHIKLERPSDIFFRDFYIPLHIQTEIVSNGISPGAFIDRLSDTITSLYMDGRTFFDAPSLLISLDFTENEQYLKIEVIIDVQRRRLSVKSLSRM